LRFLINLVWSFFYIPYLEKTEVLLAVLMVGYVLFCAYRSFNGQKFKIPR
jgi:uncharacterized membrane protein